MPVISDSTTINVTIPPYGQVAQPYNGASVSAFKASRFSGVPAENAAAPGSGPGGAGDHSPDAGPVTSGPTWGAEGAFQITVPTAEPYYLGVTINGVTGWKFCDPGAVFYAMENGAKGDGVTDDTAAITGLAGSGRTIWLQQGHTFLVSGLSFTSLTDLTITGGGSLLCSVGGNQILKLSSCTRVKVLNINAQHQTPGTRNQGHGIYLVGCTDFEVSGCEVSNTNAIGIASSTGLRGSIHNNIVHDTQADGICNNNGSHRVAVHGNVLYNTGDDSISVNSYVADSDFTSGIAITGNTIWNSTKRGIAITGGQRISISGNAVDTAAAGGIVVTVEPGGNASRTLVDVVVTGNTVSTTTATAGIDVAGNTSSPLLDGVIVANNTIRAAGYMGIRVVGNAAGATDHITITGNQIVNAYHNGIGVDANCLNCTVRGNDIYHPNQGNAAGIFGVNNLAVAGVAFLNYVVPDGGKTALALASYVQNPVGSSEALISSNFQGNGAVRLNPNVGNNNNGLFIGWDGANTTITTLDGSATKSNTLDDSHGNILAKAGVGFWNHAAPGSQPAAPVTLADVIAIIRGCGLSA